MECIIDGNSLMNWKDRYQRFMDKKVRINYDKLRKLLPADLDNIYLVVSTNPASKKQQDFFKGITDSGIYQLVQYNHHLPSPAAIIGNMVRGQDQCVLTSDANILPVLKDLKAKMITARKFCPEVTNMFIRDVDSIFINDDDVDSIFEEI